MKNLVDHGLANNPPVRFTVSTCNSLGWLGAALGGGLPRTLGSDGFMCDQLLSARVITSTGRILEVGADSSTGSHDDLWWAIRGAGPNFGLVISAEIKAYPVPTSKGATAYQSMLTYSENGFYDLIKAVDQLTLDRHMEIDFQLLSSGDPLSEFEYSAIPFYPVTDGQNASAVLERAQNLFEHVIHAAERPNADWTLLHNGHWNDGSDALCARGGRKPAWTVVMDRLDAGAFKEMVDAAKELRSKYTGKGLELIWIQAQNYYVQSESEQNQFGGSYPWRGSKTHLAMLLQYSDSAFDEIADAWGTKIRNIFRESAGRDQPGA